MKRINLRITLNGEELRLNRDERLVRTSTYGDSGVRTMGELLDKAEAIIKGQQFGVTMSQVHALLQPNRPGDIDRALRHLETQGLVVIDHQRANPMLMPAGPDLGRRIDVGMRAGLL